MLKSKQLCTNPCISSSYPNLLLNGSCISDCDAPMNLYDGICYTPCSDGANPYYDSENNECLPDCNEPNEIGYNQEYSVKTCKIVSKDIPISEEDKKSLEEIGQFQDAAGNALSGSIAASSIASSSNPSSFSTLALIKMLHYIRFIKIRYPNKVRYMLKNQNDSPISLNFGPKIPPSIKERFVSYPLPSNFADYNLHSNFIVNFWRVITSLLILLAAGYLFKLLLIISSHKGRSNKISIIFGRITSLL